MLHSLWLYDSSQGEGPIWLLITRKPWCEIAFQNACCPCYWLLLLFLEHQLLALIFQRRSMTVESPWGFGLHPVPITQNTQTKQLMMQKILLPNVQLTVISLCSADPMFQQAQTDATICTILSHHVPFVSIPSSKLSYNVKCFNKLCLNSFSYRGTRPYLSFNIYSQMILIIKPLRAICKVQEAQLMDDLWSASHKARLWWPTLIKQTQRVRHELWCKIGFTYKVCSLHSGLGGGDGLMQPC